MDYNELEVRPAAKLLLTNPNQGIIMVSGKSGRWNLPGGGLDDDPTDLSALYRELDEELQLKHEHLVGVEFVGERQAVVTPSSGPAVIARWVLFEAITFVPAAEMIPSGDVKNVSAFTYEDVTSGRTASMSSFASRCIETFM